VRWRRDCDVTSESSSSIVDGGQTNLLPLCVTVKNHSLASGTGERGEKSKIKKIKKLEEARSNHQPQHHSCLLFFFSWLLYLQMMIGFKKLIM
jgi:hypothetical protein